MANIDVGALVWAGGIGVVSAAGELLAENTVAGAVGKLDKDGKPIQPNTIMRNADKLADFGLMAYGIGNHAMDLGFPRGAASRDVMVAGTTVGTRRLAEIVGKGILGIKKAVGKVPSGSPKDTPPTLSNPYELAPYQLFDASGGFIPNPSDQSLLGAGAMAYEDAAVPSVVRAGRPVIRNATDLSQATAR